MIFRRVIRFGRAPRGRGVARGLALPFGLLAGTDDEPDYELLDEFAAGGQLPFGFLAEAALRRPTLFVDAFTSRPLAPIPVPVPVPFSPMPTPVPFSPAPAPAPAQLSFEGHDIFRDVEFAPAPAPIESPPFDTGRLA